MTHVPHNSLRQPLRMLVLMVVGTTLLSCTPKDPRWSATPTTRSQVAGRVAAVALGAALVVVLSIAANGRGNWDCPTFNCPPSR